MLDMPFDLEAERKLLGAVLRKPGLVYAETIAASWFWHESHRRIWRSIQDAVRDGVEDQLVATDVAYRLLAEMGKDYASGDVPVKKYLLGLEADSVSPEIEFELWAPRVRSSFIRRLVIGSSSKLAELASREQDGDEVIRAYADTASDLAASMGSRQLDIAGHAANWLAEVERRLTGDGVDTTRIPTGVWPLDSILGGGGTLGHYTVIMAQKKMGKSRLSTRIAYNVAKDGAHVLHFSEEMTPREMMWLYVTCHCGRPREEFFNPTDGKGKAELAAIAKSASEAVAAMNISMHCGKINVQEIILRTKAKMAAAKDAPLVVIVDYLQKIGGPHFDEYARVTHVTTELASLAKATGAWVIALSQSKRTEGNRMPSTADARSSGQIEQDVDEMVIYHRPAQNDADASNEAKREGILWLALNRHGETPRVPVHCDMLRLDFRRFDGYEF